MGVSLGVYKFSVMNIKYNVIFKLESRKDKKGNLIKENVPIRMRVSYDGDRIEFATGYRIDMSKWDADKQRVRSGCSNKLKQSATDINSDLQRYESDLRNIFKSYEVEGKKPTKEDIKKDFADKYKDHTEDRVEASLFDALDRFIAENSMSWTNGTRERFGVLESHLKAFDKALSFDSLNEDRMRDFLRYFERIGNNNTTTSRVVRHFKQFLTWSTKKGYNVHSECLGFNTKLTLTSKKVIFLTWDEIKQIQSYVIPETKNYLERVRDVFLFQCFTGLRYSDVENFRHSNIKGNNIEITTIKTADSLEIPLNDYSRAIIDKYKEYPFQGDKVLPVISNQNMNVYIKELCELARIDSLINETYYIGTKRIDKVTPKYKLMSTHVGRKTFVCVSLSLGASPQAIMKITGHSDYKAMKPYIEVADKDKIKAMQLWNKQKESEKDTIKDQLKNVPKEELLKLLSEMNIEADIESQTSATPDKPKAPKNKKKQADSVKQTRLFD